mgnify:CR=1 FL=1
MQNAILVAINSAMSNKPALLDLIKNAVSLELLPVQGQTMSLADIERRLTQLDERFQTLLAEAIDAEDMEACNARFAEILAEQTALKKQKEEILRRQAEEEQRKAALVHEEPVVPEVVPDVALEEEKAVRSATAPEGTVRYEVVADPFQIAQLEAAMREYGIKFRRV